LNHNNENNTEPKGYFEGFLSHSSKVLNVMMCG